MTKSEFLELSGSRYDQINALNIDHKGSFYDYEKEFVSLWQSLGRSVLEKSISARSSNRRKKNFTSLGKIEISNSNQFSIGKNGFQISPLPQEKMVYAGQSDCYEHSAELLKELMNIEMSTSQIYRVSDTYGEELAKDETPETVLDYPSKDNVVYVEPDGSMVFTKEEKWKEVKLARIFLDTDCVKGEGKKAGMILKSHYLAHLGGKDAFVKTVEDTLDGYQMGKPQLVFISDLASWIRNWIEDSFDESTISILDYYHGSEYLHEFANEAIKDEQQKNGWLSKQKALMLDSQIERVIKTIEKIQVKQKAKDKIVNYYKANKTEWITKNINR